MWELMQALRSLCLDFTLNPSKPASGALQTSQSPHTHDGAAALRRTKVHYMHFLHAWELTHFQLPPHMDDSSLSTIASPLSHHMPRSLSCLWELSPHRLSARRCRCCVEPLPIFYYRPIPAFLDMADECQVIIILCSSVILNIREIEYGGLRG